MDFHALAMKLLTDTPELLVSVQALLEKRWRNGRSPQPRGKDGKWIKHSTHIHVGLGSGSGTGRGTGVQGDKELRLGDRIPKAPRGPLTFKRGTDGIHRAGEYQIEKRGSGYTLTALDSGNTNSASTLKGAKELAQKWHDNKHTPRTVATTPKDKAKRLTELEGKLRDGDEITSADVNEYADLMKWRKDSRKKFDAGDDLDAETRGALGLKLFSEMTADEQQAYLTRLASKSKLTDREKADIKDYLGSDPEAPEPEVPEEPATPEVDEHGISASTRAKIDAVASSLPQSQADWDALPKYGRKSGIYQMPSDELLAHEAAVREAGAALREDYMRELDKLRASDAYKTVEAEADRLDTIADPAVQARKDAYARAKLSRSREDIQRWEELKAEAARHTKAADAARMKQRAMEQELLRGMLSQVRDFGGDVDIDNRRTAGLKIVSGGALRNVKNTPPKPIDVRRAQAAMNVYPARWAELANQRGSLLVGSRKGAVFLPGNVVNNDMLFIGNGGFDRYRGGFPSILDEAAAHEMGHRMEQSVPGLRALEFAMQRRRGTRGDGSLEPLSSMGVNGVSHADDWANPYTGKTYEDNAAKRDAAADGPWEIFTTGIEDVFGNNDLLRYAKDGDTELMDFVLGSLLTLGK